MTELISVSDIVLSVHSTVLIEALDVGKRIGCFDWFNFSNPFITSGVAFSINTFNLDDIVSIIRRELKIKDTVVSETKLTSFKEKIGGDSSLDFFSEITRIVGAKT